MNWSTSLTTLVVFGALGACDGRPVKAVHKTDIAEREVVKLFSYDGCSVYRFVDQGNYHYYANCHRLR